MSWNSYIDNLIAQSKGAEGTPHVDRACIIGIEGGDSWTTSDHPNALKLTVEEARKIGQSFNSADFSLFQNAGIIAEGVKYQFLRAEDDKLVLGKKKGMGAITLQSSKTAIVIAHCPEGSQQGNANKAVAVIAEYLESLGM